MDVVRKQVIERVDPDDYESGTPPHKAPEPDLGSAMIPKERYTTVEFMEREWEHIWSKVWLLGCREDQIPSLATTCAPTSAKSRCCCRASATAAIKAFHNVCMHRGNRLADEGLWHADSFVCGYHGWEYDSDGSFVDIPDLATFPKGHRRAAAWPSCRATPGRASCGSASTPKSSRFSTIWANWSATSSRTTSSAWR